MGGRRCPKEWSEWRDWLAAGIHHNPNPGPADAKYVCGHIWLTLAWTVRHPQWSTIGRPLRALLYIRRKHIARLPPQLGWRFQPQLQQAAELIGWLAPSRWQEELRFGSRGCSCREAWFAIESRAWRAANLRLRLGGRVRS